MENKKETKKQGCPRDWWGWVMLIIIPIIVMTPITICSTLPHTYLIKDATIEQVEQMTLADPTGRVWYSSSSLLTEASNLLEITFRARIFEKHKITEYLDSIGIEHYKLKVSHPR